MFIIYYKCMQDYKYLKVKPRLSRDQKSLHCWFSKSTLKISLACSYKQTRNRLRTRILRTLVRVRTIRSPRLSAVRKRLVCKNLCIINFSEPAAGKSQQRWAQTPVLSVLLSRVQVTTLVKKCSTSWSLI